MVHFQTGTHQPRPLCLAGKGNGVLNLVWLFPSFYADLSKIPCSLRFATLYNVLISNSRENILYPTRLSPVMKASIQKRVHQSLLACLQRQLQQRPSPLASWRSFPCKAFVSSIVHFPFRLWHDCCHPSIPFTDLYNSECAASSVAAPAALFSSSPFSSSPASTALFSSTPSNLYFGGLSP